MRLGAADAMDARQFQHRTRGAAEPRRFRAKITMAEGNGAAARAPTNRMRPLRNRISRARIV
jgi:hypothetical protein